MPLKNSGPPELWHWQQAVGWIGFDFDTPVLGFSVFDPDASAAVPNRQKRLEIASRALDDLLEAVKAKDISPISRGRDEEPEPDVLAWSETRDRMWIALSSKLAPYNHLLTHLHFRRDEIIARWPPSPEAPSQTAAAQSKCQRWLKSLAVSGELFESIPGRKRPSKTDWWNRAQGEFPQLSRRSFDRAWGQLAVEHPNLARAGRKGKSQQ
jgi:hypothetical protein